MMIKERPATRTVFRVGILLCLLTAMLGQQNPAFAASPVFITPGGSGTCAQADPCDLASGLAAVDPDGSLYAAAGTYTGSGDQVVLLDKTIDFLGGWDGAASGTPFRDPTVYESILDGQHVRRVITISGASVEPLVDGWTITGGNATGLTTHCHAHVGSGMGCGGGIHVYQADPTISHNIIEGNAALIGGTSNQWGSGGGIYIQESAGILVSTNKIRNNITHDVGRGDGAGIYIYNSGGKTSVYYNEIYENENYDSPSYHFHAGNGIMVYNNTDQVQIYNNYIHDNNPLDMYYGGTAITLQYCDNTLLIDENTITDNYGQSAMSVSYSSPTLQQNIIINSNAVTGIQIGNTDLSGAGMPALFYNNIIAMHENKNVIVTALTGEETYQSWVHNTLVDAPYGFYIEGTGSGTISFDRGIISDHSLYGNYQEIGSLFSFSVSNSLFHANGDDGETGLNPIFGDPHFVDPVAGFFTIQVSSAAINKVTYGGISEDIEDDDRPSGWGATPYDVGADEFKWLNFSFLPQIWKP
jgi:hypothetical protein